jgi:hypothetical protein
MGNYLTGIDGALYADGVKVGRVKGWTFSGSVAQFETTNLGSTAKTYVSGIQDYSGSCTVHLHEENAGALPSSRLTDGVLATTATPHDKKHRIRLAAGGRLSKREIEADVLITSVQLQASAGDVLTAAIDFTVTGGLLGTI